MTLRRRSFVLLLASSGACFADFSLGRNDGGGLIFEAPGGSIEVLSMRVRLVDLEVSAGSDGAQQSDVDFQEPGPWLFDVLAQPDPANPPVLTVPAGDWNDLLFSVTCEPQGQDPAIVLEARFRPDDGGATVDLRFTVANALLLGGERNGSTRYDSSFDVDLVSLLHPSRWFPTLNVESADAGPDGGVELAATQNAVLYAQLVDALDREARKWFDP